MNILNSLTLLLAADTPVEGAADVNIIEQLGVSWEKLLAQVLLFLIVYLILKKFAFGPIMEVLEERRKRIEAGEASLKQIEKDLADAEKTKGEILSGANKDADRLVNEARESAEALAEKKRNEATNDAANIVAKAREAGELEKGQMLSELKRDFGRLVVDTTSKVTGKVLSPEDQDKINKDTAAQISL